MTRASRVARRIALAGLFVVVAALVGALYGALFDQLTYTLSPEYYTRFKFAAFGLTDEGVPERLRAALVGVAATWWMGAGLGALLAPAMALHPTARESWRVSLRALVWVIAIAAVVALAGFFYGWATSIGRTWERPPRGRYWPTGLEDPLAFWCVGTMHDAAYLGGGIGLFVGWLVHLRARNLRSGLPLLTAEAEANRRLVASLEGLAPAAKAALDAALAWPLSYGLRVLERQGGRRLFLLGEVHLKGPRGAALGRAVVEAFPLRGLEGLRGAGVRAGPWLATVLGALYALPRVVTLGHVRGSTILVAARAPGRWFRLERREHTTPLLQVACAYVALFLTLALIAPPLFIAVRVPAWRDAVLPVLPAVTVALGVLELHLLTLIVVWRFRQRRWALWAQPALAILVERDRTMALGLLDGLSKHPAPRDVLAIVGRAHLNGMTRELVERHGFVEVRTAPEGVAEPTPVPAGVAPATRSP